MTRIGIVAPSYRPEIKEVLPAIELLEDADMDVVWGSEALNSPPRYSSPFVRLEQRIDECRAMLLDESIDIIWPMDGGAGCCYLLPSLADIEHLYPKVIFGCSDINFLQYALAGPQAYITPNLWVCDLEQIKETIRWIPAIVEASKLGKYYTGGISDHVDIISNNGSKIEGRLCPGTLSCLIHLSGTPYTEDLFNGKTQTIVLCEEHGSETPGQYEYLLWERTQHAFLTGAWSAVEVIALGDIQVGGPYDEDLFPDYREVLQHALVSRSAPTVVSGMSFGFDIVQRPIPVNVYCQVTLVNGGLSIEW